jgi:hypothetical protein
VGHVDASNVIDAGFDFRDDTPEGKDPDKSSPRLRLYHKLLWSKPLPSGRMFELNDTTRDEYLYHKSDLGEFHLASDAMVASFRYLPMVKAEPEQLDEFMYIGYTMGGMMLWPGNKIDGKMTINGERGFNPKIRDRVDFTMECIRRHYLSEWSPMQECLARYADFFRLFEDFRGFVEFFLLQDAVTADCEAVVFSTPFEDFAAARAVPKTMSEYREYREAAIAFIEARNRRILRFCSEHSSTWPMVDTKPIPNPMEAVLQLAGQFGTRDQLQSAIRVAAEKGLRVRAHKACLMFTPPSNATRCLFTLRAQPAKDGLQVWVEIEAFTEFFSVGRAEVEEQLGAAGWRHLDELRFEALLQGLVSLDLSSRSIHA